ncbi:MAG TPA: hypothetical protein VIO62_00090 [Candidatus Dormibacteraeota bacterium]
MTDAPVRRFQIRYSIQRWEDGKWFYGGFLIILVGLTIFKIIRHEEIASVIPVLVVDGVVVLGLYLLRLVSYVDIAPDGLRIRYVFRQMDVPYTALSRVRRQALDVAFQPAERRRFVNRFVRRLAKEPAAYLRLDRRQPEVLAEAEKRLGPRLVAGPDIVIPLADVDAFIAEMKGRLHSA